MSGLLGIVQRNTDSDLLERFDRMSAAMRRGGSFLTETTAAPDGRWALGRFHLGILQPRPQLTTPSTVQAVFHGELFDRTCRIDEAARRGMPTEPPVDDVQIVRELYRAHGTAFVERLKGTFCLAIVDEEAGRVMLATDRMGSYPLYWFQEGDTFAFASELRALLRVHPRPALNPHAVNDLIKLTFPFGDKTLAAGIRVIPPSTAVTWDLGSGDVQTERYASWSSTFARRVGDRTEYLERIGRAFDASMDRSLQGEHRYGLSLSGGLDTRVILSATDRRKVPLSTFTLGGRGCADEVIGERLARMAKSTHRFVALEAQALASLLPITERMVALTDGMYTSDGFTEVLALQDFEQADFDVLLRGHLGELAKAGTAYPFHTDAQVMAMTSREQLVPHLLDRLESLNHGSSARGLFTGAWEEAYDEQGARRSMEQALADVELPTPADLCAYLYLHEYHPRLTVPSLEVFRAAVEVRVPLADPEFVECVFQGPPEWRTGTQIHQWLIRRSNPAFLRVRNPNTGAPAGAGPLQEFVLDKLNSVLRRLNVYGYRHYHAFDGWMRKAFLDVAERVLLSPATLDRGIVRPAALRRLLDEARNGADHDHVLQVLTIVELWQRTAF